MTGVSRLTKRSSWESLQTRFQEIRSLHLRDLFAQDPSRGNDFAIDAVGIYLDYSKNRVTQETLKGLFALSGCQWAH